MKNYVKKLMIVSTFALFVFLCGTNSASAFSFNLGFSMGGFNSYGYGNNGGYNVPINCFNAGYPCNGYFGGNDFGYNNNFGNNMNMGYNNNFGNNMNMGYGGYSMSSPTYYNSNSYNDYYPTRTYGGYVNPNMYSNWYGN